MPLPSLVESLLFVSTRPLSARKLSELTGEPTGEVEAALHAIAAEYKERSAGLRLAQSGKDWQFMTSPDNARSVQEFIREEMTGELTRPSLEALTIIAYRGPVTKAEIEQIRGVNCSLILRNLMIRGLAEAETVKKTLLTRYRVTLDFLRFLGVASVEELPDYARLSSDKVFADLLAAPGGSGPSGV
ncbi:SMC-Scp complex subunit ScpB [Patescibacteria group bacterium]|nr:MAG: SMC-Scp complex subunit ScpB [Patescibacteria group bacterium]